jgi:hypothetical protein
MNFIISHLGQFHSRSKRRNRRLKSKYKLILRTSTVSLVVSLVGVLFVETKPTSIVRIPDTLYVHLSANKST